LLSRDDETEREIAMRVSPIAVALTVATGLALVVTPGSVSGAAGAAGGMSRPAVAKPGVAGSVITLTSGASFDGESMAYQIASDRSGTAYLAWISAKNSASGREIHLCTLPPGAKGCKGGVQSITTPESQSAAGIHLLVSRQGLATLLWYVSASSDGGIYESMSTRGSTLSAAKRVIPSSGVGVFMDAEAGPHNQIWTVLQPTYSKGLLEIRPGLSASPVSIKTPYNLGYAQLAFSKSTPILAITESASLSAPVAYSSRPGSSWTSFKNVRGTYVDGRDIGLTRTSSGVRLTTGSPVDFGASVVSRWTRHGFAKAVRTGDRSDCVASSHYTTTDKSGRLVDVSNECDKIAVSNLPNTRRASIIRFGAPANATVAGGEPAITSTPRGRAWVAWSTLTGSAGGETLKVAPFLLPGLRIHKRGHAAHGSVTVTGPASCQPADVIKVGVKGHASKGWKVAKTSLRLGKKKVHKTINGARLRAGKRYVLVGSAIFTNGHAHSKGKAKLTFRSCPTP
jgi:hypothetical protein